MLNGNKKDIVQPLFSSYISFFLFFLLSFILLFLLCFAPFHYLSFILSFIFLNILFFSFLKNYFCFWSCFLLYLICRGTHNASHASDRASMFLENLCFVFFFSNFTRDFIIENKEMKNRNKWILRIIFIFRDNIF